MYLSVQHPGGQFALHTAVVCRVHPQQELPASGEGDGQRVEDFSGVDAGRQTPTGPFGMRKESVHTVHTLDVSKTV